MQNLFSTEALVTTRGKTLKTKTHSEDRVIYDEDSDIDERQSNPFQHKAIEMRDDSSEVQDDLEGPVVSSSQGTKLFSLITKRNWPATIQRCKGEGGVEAMTWIIEKNMDGSTRWKLLPIHQVSTLLKLC